MSVISLPKDMLEINILLVEDMTFYHSIIPQMLNNYGFSGEFYSGKTLKDTEKTIKELYKSGKKIDLIITDFLLPDGTGLDVVKKIRQNQVLSNIPVLMITTDDHAKNVLEAFEAGIDNYLFKPLDEKLFVEKIIFIWKKRHSVI